MEHTRDNEGITGNPFDDMIDIMFNEWLIEFCRVTDQNPIDFRTKFSTITEDLQKAFRGGWLECERFYEKS